MSKKDLTQFFYRATDTFRELFAYLAIAIVIAGTLFAIFENVTIWKGIWWALITAFTVGYGDTVPQTRAGEVLTAVLLSFSVFVIVPLIIARFSKIAIVNDDAFTHNEQQQLKRDVAFIRRHIENQATQKSASVVTAGTLGKATATYNLPKKSSKKKK